ncbi:MAG: PIG-L deacetylase family protein [Christensenellaceae bacterium]
MADKPKILIVAAHPDDEILGCGATMKKYSQEFEIHTLILGAGKDSRKSGKSASENFEQEKLALKKEAATANQAIGCENVVFADFPDNRFDSVALLDIVKKIDEVKASVKPQKIFTHFKGDLNIDHKITYDAVLTATRPMQDETVKEIYAFEILSSTEWNYPLSFCPNFFVDVTSQIQDKVEAMQAYKSELRDYPHPRSVEAIFANAKYWAFRTGIDGYAEAFEIVRIVK